MFFVLLCVRSPKLAGEGQKEASGKQTCSPHSDSRPNQGGCGVSKANLDTQTEAGQGRLSSRFSP